MLEIILARHGETDWNVTELFRGRIDVELNKTGETQAELLSEYLRSARIDAVYASPLKRALKTARTLAQYHSVAVSMAPGLIDFDYGKWQGLSHQEVKEKYKELYTKWSSHPQRVKMPAGESLGDVRKRALAVVDNIINKHSDGTVVLMSHRVVNKVLICAMLGLNDSHFWNIRLDTCAITTFDYENSRFILVRHNDTSFLRPMGKKPSVDF